jgi:hypothetical protein
MAHLSICHSARSGYTLGFRPTFSGGAASSLSEDMVTVAGSSSASARTKLLAETHCGSRVQADPRH